ncbi:alpha/beta hydrolase [Ideonella margarita]|uniref:Alpha/beta hydrolase n=1 Tax=Ideonella margarita TaxID=2984191 RepID=A0ABU9C2Z7_9BURK
MTTSLNRRRALQGALAASALTLTPLSRATTTNATAATTTKDTNAMTTTSTWDKVFPRSERVIQQKISFNNRYGIPLVADLYTPGDASAAKLPAIVLSGPFGAVKEQSSGLYAQQLAERGFITLAFDPSFTGESGGAVRNVASPEIFTEDFSAAVDQLGLMPNVDRERIGVMAICGLSGMALTAATSDSRIKAVATASMYDMSRSISRGYRDRYTPGQRQKIIAYLGQRRWNDAALGRAVPGLHELFFDDSGKPVELDRCLPESLPPDANPVLAAFFNYYRTPRGFHARSINSTTAWTATSPMPFFAFPMATHLDMLSPRPIMLIAGAQAHSLYYSEDIYKAAPGPKELVVVPGADHVDLYDRLDKIPFNQIAAFFRKSLG